MALGRESEVSSCDAQAEDLGLSMKEIDVLVHWAELHVARTAGMLRKKKALLYRLSAIGYRLPAVGYRLSALAGTRVHTMCRMRLAPRSTISAGSVLAMQVVTDLLRMYRDRSQPSRYLGPCVHPSHARRRQHES